MENLVGRKQEIKILQEAIASGNAELIAVYGRRRVGKTHLIHQVYQRHIKFEFVGAHNATMQEQLESFSIALKKAINSPVDLAIPKTWVAAFHALANILETITLKEKTVVFFDEFP